jgi:hypothetical protein
VLLFASKESDKRTFKLNRARKAHRVLVNSKPVGAVPAIERRSVTPRELTMGKALVEATFPAPAPKAAAIAARVTDLVGLPLIVSESSSEFRGRLYDLHARVAFAAYPKEEVTLSAYRPSVDRAGMATGPLADVVQGSREVAGTQKVYIEGYVGQEPTLLFATLLALEALGGHLTESVSEEERRNYGRTISPEELGRRYHKTQRKGLVAVTGGVIVAACSIIWWSLGMFIRLPFGGQKQDRIGQIAAVLAIILATGNYRCSRRLGCIGVVLGFAAVILYFLFPSL